MKRKRAMPMPGQRWIRKITGGVRLGGREININTQVTVIAVKLYGENIDVLLLTDSGSLGQLLFVPEFWELMV